MNKTFHIIGSPIRTLNTFVSQSPTLEIYY